MHPLECIRDSRKRSSETAARFERKKERERLDFRRKGGEAGRREGREMCSSKDLRRWWRDCRAKQNPFRTRSHVLSASQSVTADEIEEEAKEDKEEEGKERKPSRDDTFETEI